MKTGLNSHMCYDLSFVDPTKALSLDWEIQIYPLILEASVSLKFTMVLLISSSPFDGNHQCYQDHHNLCFYPDHCV